MSKIYTPVSLVCTFIAGVLFTAWLHSPAPAAAISTSEAKPQTEFTSVKISSGYLSVYLLTDSLTKCEYLYNSDGGMTPRMHSDGIQVCGTNTYPNGEADFTDTGVMAIHPEFEGD